MRELSVGCVFGNAVNYPAVTQRRVGYGGFELPFLGPACEEALSSRNSWISIQQRILLAEDSMAYGIHEQRRGWRFFEVHS
jgi:hypothetical protein